MRIAERYAVVLSRFEEAMPVAETELHYDTPFHLLMEVILSAQCTDKRVNMITPALFEAYPDAESMARASQDEIFEFIKSCSYPNNKARSLCGMSRRLVEEFGGEVPQNMEDLLSLPGVGRKTANVVLAVVFGEKVMAVDTHVFRVSERLGLTTGSRTPLATEKTLMKYLPPDDVPRAHHWLILHGRYVCKARKPDCEACELSDLCRYHSTAMRKSAAVSSKDVENG